MAAEYVIIAIIVVIAAIFIGFYLIKKQNHNNIEELKERRNNLMDGVPTQKLKQIKRMDISGQSLAYANRLEEDWKKIESGKNITVENNIYDAEQSADRYRFKASKDHQQRAHEEMEIIEQDLNKLTESLDEVIYREDENDKRMSGIQEDYQAIRKQLLANSFSYGEAVDQLENKLAEMENEFNAYEQLTKANDHEEARKVLVRLEKMVDNMDQYMDDIPAILKRIDDEFQGQIEEIEEAYDQLEAEGFIFPGEPIQTEVSAVDQEIVELNNIVGSLEIEEANRLADQIASHIDRLYDRMEDEIEARDSVSELETEIQKAIYYLAEEVRVLFFEIDRVSQSYVLVHDEYEQINQLKDEVNAVKVSYEKLVDNVGSKFISYSEAEESLNSLKDELIEINDRKNSVTDQLYSYRDEEAELKDNVSAMEHRVREIKRTLNQQNLPGLPNEYQEYYTYVSNMLTSLSEELARPKLKVEKIHELHEISKEEVDSLEKETQKLIDDVILTEIFAQRLYRYRDEYPEVAASIQQSENLFNDHSDYDSSVTVVRNKLYEIDSAVAEKLETDYLNDREVVI